MKKRCLITGGTGFIGRNLIDRLVADGHECHVLSLESSDRLASLQTAHGKGVYIKVCDIANNYMHLRLLVNRIKPHWIFHLAAQGTNPEHSGQAQVDVNIISTWNMLEATRCYDYEVFIYTSSSLECGRSEIPIHENLMLQPDTLYGATKASGTMLVTQIARKTGKRCIVLRIFCGYGPHERTTRLIPQLIILGKEGRLPPLVAPDTARDYIYSEDIVEGIIRAAEYEGENPIILNLGTGRQRTLREVVEVARTQLDIEAEPEWNTMPDCQFDTKHWQADMTKLKATLEWEPRHDFESGFAKTVKFMQSDQHIKYDNEHDLMVALGELK